MPFDEQEFRDSKDTWGAFADRAGIGRAVNGDMHRDLRMYHQAGINAEHVTGDPAWDQLLTFWQAQIETAMQRRAAFIAELASPLLTNMDQITVTRNEVFKLDEQIRVLTWVIAMPAQIKTLGGVAKKRLDEAEAVPA